MQNCKFNPLKPAKFHCSKCNADFCDEYSEEVFIRRGEEPSYRCFICDSAMNKLANTTQIEPFWRRIADIYKYPFSSGSAIAVIVVTSLLTMLLKHSVLLLLAPSVMIILYSFACLRETARGELIAPGFEKCIDGSTKTIFFVYAVLFIAIFIAVMIASILGQSIALLFGLFCLAALPASILLIAIDEQLLPALNPFRLIGIISKTGSSYFVMILFVIIMMSSVALISHSFGDLAFTSIGLFLQTAISNYYSIVMFHIMGYLVFQNHEQLGFKINQSKNNARARSSEQSQNSKIELLIKAGRYKAAFDECEQQIRRSNTEWQRARHFKLACIACPPKKLAEQLSSYIKFLNKHDRQDQVADAFMLAIKSEPELQITDPKLSLDIAE